MAGANSVQVLPAWQLLRLPHRVVPAAAQNPFPGSGFLRALCDALLHLLQRLHANQINFELGLSSVGEMTVRIVEPRHVGLANEIEDLSLCALVGKELVTADWDDIAVGL